MLHIAVARVLELLVSYVSRAVPHTQGIYLNDLLYHIPNAYSHFPFLKPTKRIPHHHFFQELIRNTVFNASSNFH